MKTLSIIGCGTVGKTLAKLWCDKGVFAIGHILNRRTTSALDAKKFIGAGQVAEQFNDLSPADLWLIATPDDAITDACKKLADTGLLRAGDTVFHTSGALTSASLMAICNAQVVTASLHPIKSFVDSATAVNSFAGTFCTFEGQEKAQEILQLAEEAINGHFIYLTAANKPLYHAGTTILCNYLCTLMDFGLNALVASGVNRTQATQAVAPIMRETLENVLTLGSASALTGPIARGDLGTVHKQLAAIDAALPQHAEAFRVLGQLTVALSAIKGGASQTQLDDIRKLLSGR